MATEDEYTFSGGNILIPMDLGGQGGDATCVDESCIDVRAVQYPFERRPDEGDGDYVIRLRQRYNELLQLAGIWSSNTPMLDGVDPAYRAEMVALYYALLHDIGVPDEGLTIPATNLEDYTAFALLFGVSPEDWLMAEPAADSIQTLFADEPEQWITSNMGPGGASIWAAGTFPGPDGRVYYRITSVENAIIDLADRIFPGDQTPTEEFDPILGAYVSQGYAFPSATFDDQNAGWLRDFFWEIYGFIGADIALFGPPPADWFDEAANTNVESINIFYGARPQALAFEPFDVAQNGTAGLRSILAGRVRQGTVGVNRTHRGTVFRRLAAMRSDVRGGLYSQSALNTAFRTHGAPLGVNSRGDLRAMARRDPLAARDLANKIRSSALLRSPARQAQMQAARGRSERAIEAGGAQVNWQGFTTQTRQGQTITVVPDGLRGAVISPQGRLMNATEVHEGKDVSVASHTRQIQGELSLARRAQAVFVFHVRPNTHLTGPLKQAFRQQGGGGVRVQDFDGNIRTDWQ